MIKLLCVLMYWGDFSISVPKTPHDATTVANGQKVRVVVSDVDYLQDDSMNWIEFQDVENGYTFTVPMTCEVRK